MNRSILPLVFYLILSPSVAQEIRIATYNIKFLDTSISSQRKNNLKEVIQSLDADIIALQEIDDRAALENLFDKTRWHIIIDDNSRNSQDVALAVRKDHNIVGLASDLDADSDDFLFPESYFNSPFPNRRDVLKVEVDIKDFDQNVIFFIQHLKARNQGRNTTEFRRVDAAIKLLRKLESDYDETFYVVLGDFNDNPDDRSANILETGNPNTQAEAEDYDGAFLINLAEDLLVKDAVSWRRDGFRYSTGSTTLTSEISGSRYDNIANVGRNVFVENVLLDQILIVPRMKQYYVPNSISVFNHISAHRGAENNKASDHLPVYADFIFNEEGGTSNISVRIKSLLPNPKGIDAGNEKITLVNNSSNQINLSGWYLLDRSENKYELTGNIDINNSLTITLKDSEMPLNNNGDAIQLYNYHDNMIHQIIYAGYQVEEGKVIDF